MNAMSAAVAATPVTSTFLSPTPIATASDPDNHPKTGERRRVQRSLRLDSLPVAMLERVRAQRAAGRTWEEIEHDSMDWPEWDDVSDEVLSGFPDRRLPHTNLRRWYDLRVEQVERRQAGLVLAAQALGDRLAEHGFKNLNASVKNGLASMVFGMMAEGGDQKVIREELYRLAKVILAIDRAEIAQERLRLQKRREEGEGDRRSALRQEPVGNPRSVVSQKEAAKEAVAVAAPAKMGETPRPPASARVGTAVGNQRSAIGQQEAVPGGGSEIDQELALIGQVFGPELRRMLSA